jgi:predicted small secreted protein
MSPSHKIIWFVVLASAVLAATGCNTAQGFGKDVEKTGEKIQQKTR